MWMLAGMAIAGAVKGMAGDKDANNQTEGNYTSDKNQAYADYTANRNRSNEYRAGVTNNREDSQWEADNANAVSRGHANQGMWGSKYQVKQLQSTYDNLIGEFGDMADNIKGHFESLSPSSVKAQNNEQFNLAYQNEIEAITQDLGAQGINPGSGLAMAMKGMARNKSETGKVMANRNVETEVAQAKLGFMDYGTNSPLFQGRPVDFDEGMLTDKQTGHFAPNNPNQINDVNAEGWDTEMAYVGKGPKQSGGAFMGAIGGVAGGLGSVFGGD